jgi:hypothetical protein
MRPRGHILHPFAALGLIVLAATCFSVVATVVGIQGWLRVVTMLVVGALLAAVLLPRIFRWLSVPHRWGDAPRLRLPGGYYVDPFIVSFDDFSLSRSSRPFHRRRRVAPLQPDRSRYYDVHIGGSLVASQRWQVADIDRSHSRDARLRGRLFRYWWLRALATTGDQPTLDKNAGLRPVTVIPVGTTSARRRAEAFTEALQPIGVELRIVDVSAPVSTVHESSN